MNRFIKKEEYTDAEVIEGLQNNNREIERNFCRSCKAYFKERYMGVMVIRRGARDEEDLFQDSFLKLWKEIQARRIYIRDNYAWRTDNTGVDRKMSASLRTYLMAIAKYKNYEMIREEEIYVSEQLNVSGSDDEEPQLPIRHDSIEEESDEHISEWIVGRCVDELPPRCKDILTLFYYEGKSLDEILAIRDENQSKDGLKTGKSKCMKTLKNRILEQFSRYNIKPYSHV